MSTDPLTYGTGHAPMPFPKNDRTWLAETQAAMQQEQRAEDELRAHEMMGAGAAAFCVSFWETIRGAEPTSVMRFSRDEALRLLEAALRGR